MSKNFWKMATIGLAGYVIGREHRTYTGPVRYNYGASQDHSKSFVSTFAKALGENIGKKLLPKNQKVVPKDVIKRVNSIELKTKDDACQVKDYLSSLFNSYGIVTVADYLVYLKEHPWHLKDDELKIDAKFNDINFGWENYCGIYPILKHNGSWTLTFSPIQYLRSISERYKENQ